MSDIRRSRPNLPSLPESFIEGSRQSRSSSMFERSELRRSREGQMENGVKNLKGVKGFPKSCYYHREIDAYIELPFLKKKPEYGIRRIR